jgi:hypothetical protein
VATLTLTVDDHVLETAQRRALAEGISVNALLRAYLGRYAGAVSAHQEAVGGLIQLARTTRSGRGRRHSSRNELHDRRERP